MKKNRRKEKKLSKKNIILLIICLIILVIISLFTFNKNSNVPIIPSFKYKDRMVIEAGDKVPTMNDFLYKNVDKEKEIVWEDIDIVEGKIYKIGTYNGKFNYDGEERKIVLIVKDTTCPIIEGVKDIEILAYEFEPDFLGHIKVNDNSNEEIKAKVEGDYDIEKVGEYNLRYKAVDSSKNETIKEFKLIVKENKDVTVSKSKKGYTIKNDHGITYIDNVIIANKSYGLPSNFSPNNLVDINGYIRVVDFVKDAFSELSSDAKAVGLNIYASSGYRSYSDQNYIYNNYVQRDGVEQADTYSARAGYSEHQTGLAIDVNTVDMSFDNTNESIWLKENAYKYGFIIRYPKDKDNITGYMYEPWHIRYVGKKLAKELYSNGDYITLEEYFGIDSKYK